MSAYPLEVAFAIKAPPEDIKTMPNDISLSPMREEEILHPNVEEHVNDSWWGGLSPKAIGLFYIIEELSSVEGWRWSIVQLAIAINGKRTGLDSIRSGLAELEDAGILKRSMVRNSGKLSHSVWTVKKI